MMIREYENLSHQHQSVKINNKGRMSNFNYEIFMTGNLNYIVSFHFLVIAKGVR